MLAARLWGLTDKELRVSQESSKELGQRVKAAAPSPKGRDLATCVRPRVGRETAPGHPPAGFSPIMV